MYQSINFNCSDLETAMVSNVLEILLRQFLYTTAKW